MKVVIVVIALITLFVAFVPNNDEKEASIKRGKEVYTSTCQHCHMDKGQGVTGTFPPLAGADYLKDVNKTIHAIKYGLEGEIEVNGVTYYGFMSKLGLSNKEVADVANFILNSWGNRHEELVTEEEVEKLEK